MLRPHFLFALIAVLGLAATAGRAAGAPAAPQTARPDVEKPKDAEANKSPAKGQAQGKANRTGKGKTLHGRAKRLPPGMELRTGEAAIEKALREPVTLDVHGMPLGDVIDLLKEQCRVEIVLDISTWPQVGIGGKSPVTKRFHRLPLRSALALTLRDFDALTFTVRDDVLLVTTRELAEKMLETRVLDVSDLVVYRDEHGALRDNYDTLIDTITSMIAPVSWVQVGGRGAISGASIGGAKVLAIRQTWDVHRQIADALAAIRAIAKKNPAAAPPRYDNPPLSSAKADGDGRRATRGGLGRSQAKPAARPKKEPSEDPGDDPFDP